MKCKIQLFLLILLTCMSLVSAQSQSISGYIEDSKTGERLIGAYVIDSISNKGTSTNVYGFFNLKNLHGKTILRATYLGYKSASRKINLLHDTVLNFSINPVSEIKEITIESSLYNRNINTPMGINMIPQKMLTSIPALGEADLLKAIQSQPGIKGGLEGSSGIFVRGGGSGENLYLLDDVPMYNVSHLYGFFSAFNVSAVKDVKLITGCFPARYGGRTSSVIDVRSLDGNNKKVKGEVSLGLVSSKFTVQGPLMNEKTTLMLSGRRSYFDLFTEPMKKQGWLDKSFPYYYFYDVNARLAHTFSQNDKVYLNFYKGKDNIINTNENSEVSNSLTEGFSEKFTEKRQETSGWGNIIGSIRWNHIYGNHIFENTTIAYSRYDYFIKNDYSSVLINYKDPDTITRNYSAAYTASIKDFTAKTDFDYSLTNNNLLRFGIGITYHTFNPGKNHYVVTDQEMNDYSDVTYQNDAVQASEPYFYFEDEMKIGQKIIMNTGIRLSGFISGKTTFFYPEPRLSLNYTIHQGLVLKAGYSRMTQYIHLLSNATVSMPTDLWVPSVKGLNPLQSDQVNLGFAVNLSKFALLSLEVYRKWLNNTSEFRNGASLTTDLRPWYNKITQGKGNAKGIEVSLEKQTGSITGGIHYTLSSSDRNYEELANGQTFPFAYDRRHDFNIFANFRISEKWDVSAMWVYGSGYPVTLPVEKYLPDLGIYNIQTKYGQEISYYPSPNNFRLPPYHRLDLGVHYKTQHQRGESIWSFDIFNAYNRSNPVYMYYSGYGKKTLLSGSLLPIIPSVTFTFKTK